METISFVTAKFFQVFYFVNESLFYHLVYTPRQFFAYSCYSLATSQNKIDESHTGILSPTFLFVVFSTFLLPGPDGNIPAHGSLRFTLLA